MLRITGRAIAALVAALGLAACTKIDLGEPRFAGAVTNRPRSSMLDDTHTSRWLMYHVAMRTDELNFFRTLSSSFALGEYECKSKRVLYYEDIFVSSIPLNTLGLNFDRTRWDHIRPKGRVAQGTFYVNPSRVTGLKSFCIKVDGGTMYGWRVYTDEIEVHLPPP